MEEKNFHSISTISGCSLRYATIAARASSSQRLFSSLSACPATLSNTTLCVFVSVSNSCQRSTFETPFPSAFFPVLFRPTVYPTFQKGVHRVRRIAVYVHFARILQAFQSVDDSKYLHTVIRRFPLCSGIFALKIPVNEYPRVSADPRISRTSTVGI